MRKPTSELKQPMRQEDATLSTESSHEPLALGRGLCKRLIYSVLGAADSLRMCLTHTRRHSQERRLKDLGLDKEWSEEDIDLQVCWGWGVYSGLLHATPHPTTREPDSPTAKSRTRAGGRRGASTGSHGRLTTQQFHYGEQPQWLTVVERRREPAAFLEVAVRAHHQH